MKARPFKIVDGAYVDCTTADATHIKLHFPGPSSIIVLPVMIAGVRRGTPNWTWNGDTEKPTIKPSVLTRGGTYVCHSWVNDGRVQFLADCTHEFAGKTLDLLDVPDATRT